MKPNPHQDHLPLYRRVRDIVEIESKSAIESGSLGYMAKCLVLATLPHSNPISSVFERKNGDFNIRLTDVLGYGLPFGSYPRLLLAWLYPIVSLVSLWITLRTIINVETEARKHQKSIDQYYSTGDFHASIFTCILRKLYLLLISFDSKGFEPRAQPDPTLTSRLLWGQLSCVLMISIFHQSNFTNAIN